MMAAQEAVAPLLADTAPSKGGSRKSPTNKGTNTVSHDAQTQTANDTGEVREGLLSLSSSLSHNRPTGVSGNSISKLAVSSATLAPTVVGHPGKQEVLSPEEEKQIALRQLQELEEEIRGRKITKEDGRRTRGSRTRSVAIQSDITITQPHLNDANVLNNNNNNNNKENKIDMKVDMNGPSQVGTSNVLETMKQQFLQGTEKVTDCTANGLASSLRNADLQDSPTLGKRRPGRPRKPGMATKAVIPTPPILSSPPSTPCSPSTPEQTSTLIQQKNIFPRKSITKGLREVRKIENGSDASRSPLSLSPVKNELLVISPTTPIIATPIVAHLPVTPISPVSTPVAVLSPATGQSDSKTPATPKCPVVPDTAKIVTISTQKPTITSDTTTPTSTPTSTPTTTPITTPNTASTNTTTTSATGTVKSKKVTTPKAAGKKAAGKSAQSSKDTSQEDLTVLNGHEPTLEAEEAETKTPLTKKEAKKKEAQAKKEEKKAKEEKKNKETMAKKDEGKGKESLAKSKEDLTAAKNKENLAKSKEDISKKGEEKGKEMAKKDIKAKETTKKDEAKPKEMTKKDDSKAKETGKKAEAKVKEVNKKEETPAKGKDLSKKEEAKAKEATKKEDAKTKEAVKKEEAKGKEAKTKELSKKEEAKAKEIAKKEEAKAKETAKKEEAKAKETAKKEEAKQKENQKKDDSKSKEAKTKEMAKKDDVKAKETGKKDEVKVTKKAELKGKKEDAKSKETLAEKDATKTAETPSKETAKPKETGKKKKKVSAVLNETKEEEPSETAPAGSKKDITPKQKASGKANSAAAKESVAPVQKDVPPKRDSSATRAAVNKKDKSEPEGPAPKMMKLDSSESDKESIEVASPVSKRNRARQTKKGGMTVTPPAKTRSKVAANIATVIADVHNSMNGEPQTIIPASKSVIGKRNRISPVRGNTIQAYFTLPGGLDQQEEKPSVEKGDALSRSREEVPQSSNSSQEKSRENSPKPHTVKTLVPTAPSQEDSTKAAAEALTPASSTAENQVSASDSNQIKDLSCETDSTKTDVASSSCNTKLEVPSPPHTEPSRASTEMENKRNTNTPVRRVELETNSESVEINSSERNKQESGNGPVSAETRTEQVNDQVPVEIETVNKSVESKKLVKETEKPKASQNLEPDNTSEVHQTERKSTVVESEKVETKELAEPGKGKETIRVVKINEATQSSVSKENVESPKRSKVVPPKKTPEKVEPKRVNKLIETRKTSDVLDVRKPVEAMQPMQANSDAEPRQTLVGPNKVVEPKQQDKTDELDKTTAVKEPEGQKATEVHELKKKEVTEVAETNKTNKVVEQPKETGEVEGNRTIVVEAVASRKTIEGVDIKKNKFVLKRGEIVPPKKVAEVVQPKKANEVVEPKRTDEVVEPKEAVEVKKAGDAALPLKTVEVTPKKAGVVVQPSKASEVMPKKTGVAVQPTKSSEIVQSSTTGVVTPKKTGMVTQPKKVEGVQSNKAVEIAPKKVGEVDPKEAEKIHPKKAGEAEKSGEINSSKAVPTPQLNKTGEVSNKVPETKRISEIHPVRVTKVTEPTKVIVAQATKIVEIVQHKKTDEGVLTSKADVVVKPTKLIGVVQPVKASEISGSPKGNKVTKPTEVSEMVRPIKSLEIVKPNKTSENAELQKSSEVIKTQKVGEIGLQKGKKVVSPQKVSEGVKQQQTNEVVKVQQVSEITKLQKVSKTVEQQNASVEHQETSDVEQKKSEVVEHSETSEIVELQTSEPQKASEAVEVQEISEIVPVETKLTIGQIETNEVPKSVGIRESLVKYNTNKVLEPKNVQASECLEPSRTEVDGLVKVQGVPVVQTEVSKVKETEKAVELLKAVEVTESVETDVSDLRVASVSVVPEILAEELGEGTQIVHTATKAEKTGDVEAVKTVGDGVVKTDKEGGEVEGTEAAASNASVAVGQGEKSEVGESVVTEAKVVKKKVPKFLKQLFADEGVQNMLKSMGEDAVPVSDISTEPGTHKLRPKRLPDPSTFIDDGDLLQSPTAKRKKRGTELDTLYMDEGVLNLLTSIESGSRRVAQSDDTSSDISQPSSVKSSRVNKIMKQGEMPETRKRKLSGSSGSSLTNRSTQPPEPKKARVEGREGMGPSLSGDQGSASVPQLVTVSQHNLVQVQVLPEQSEVAEIKRRGRPPNVSLNIKQKSKEKQEMATAVPSTSQEALATQKEIEVIRVPDTVTNVLSRAKEALNRPTTVPAPATESLRMQPEKAVPPLKIKIASERVALENTKGTPRPVIAARPTVLPQFATTSAKPTKVLPRTDYIDASKHAAKATSSAAAVPTASVSSYESRISPKTVQERRRQSLERRLPVVPSPAQPRRMETPNITALPGIPTLERNVVPTSAGPSHKGKRGAGESLRQSQRASVRQSEGSYHFRDIALRKFNNFMQIILNPSTTKMKNALNSRVLRELCEVLNTLKRDDSIRMVLFTATGTTFCQGVDLTSLQHHNIETRKKNAENLVRGIKDFIKALMQFPKPIVAGVNGSATGIGVTMLPLFDMVIANDKADFFLPYSRLGQVPEGGATYTFPNLFGKLQSTHLFLGRKLTSTQAEKLGLVSETLWPATYQEELIPKIALMATHSAQSMQATKALMNHHLITKLELSLESECRLLLQQWTSPHFAQLSKRFLESNHVQLQKPVNLPL